MTTPTPSPAPAARCEMHKEPAIRCDGCGKFIAYVDIDTGRARSTFTPLNEFGPERIEWECPRCTPREKEERDG